MKKILLAIIAAVSFGSAQAQSFTTQYGDSASAAFQTMGVEIQTFNPISSTSSTPVYIKYKVVGHSANLDLANNWAFEGLCDNNVCIYNNYTYFQNPSVSAGYTQTAGDFHTLMNGDNAANGTYAWVIIEMKDTVANFTKNKTFIATKGMTGISKSFVSDDNVTIFPNPAKANLNVIFDKSLNIKTIGVYNLIGKMVANYKITPNAASAQLDLGTIPQGVYYVRLVDDKGQVAVTRRFTRQ